MQLKTMCVIALLLLLASGNTAFATSSAGATDAPMLQEWLESVVGPTVTNRPAAGRMDASRTAQGGHYLEKESLCLRASLQKSCFDESVLRSKVDCCKPEHHDGYEQDPSDQMMMDFSQLEVGVCTWTRTEGLNNNYGIVLTPNVASVGSSFLACTLNKAAEECGPIGCAELTLTAQVDTYMVGYAIVEGDVSGALSLDGASVDNNEGGPGCVRPQCETEPYSPFCDDIKIPIRDGKRVVPVKPSLKHSLGTGSKNITHKAPRRNGDPTDVTIAVFLAYANGPVTISSKTHETKWQAGWVDFIIPVNLRTEVGPERLQDFEQAVGPLPTVSAKDFGKLKFQLFKHAEHY